MRVKCITPNSQEYDMELRGEWSDDALLETFAKQIGEGYRYFVFDRDQDGIKIGREITTREITKKELVLPGWFCPACGGFVGEAKEKHPICYHCDGKGR